MLWRCIWVWRCSSTIHNLGIRWSLVSFTPHHRHWQNSPSGVIAFLRSFCQIVSGFHFFAPWTWRTLYPSYPLDRGWVGPKASLDTAKERKISHSCQELNPDSSAIQLIACCYMDWVTLIPLNFLYTMKCLFQTYSDLMFIGPNIWGEKRQKILVRRERDSIPPQNTFPCLISSSKHFFLPLFPSNISPHLL
jgi:hypothetical protein